MAGLHLNGPPFNGPVAQLGERHNGIVEVMGSIPFRSKFPRRSGGTGRRARLKIVCPQGHEGSTPSFGIFAFSSRVHL